MKTVGGPLRLAQIVHQDTNALHGVSWSLQEPEAALTELDLVSVLDRDVREQRAGPGAEIDARSGATGKFAMPRDEVGMQVGLDDVFDLPSIAGCGIEIDIHITLGIDNCGNPLRNDT